MIKCFLSHSSSDKDRFVRPVASKIYREARIFDEETFEAGMPPAEEIASALDETAIFVIFLSTKALESSWVQNELGRAKLLFDESKLQRIFPIIIEDGITHLDSRIPGWMRESLNIQPISKPSIAARKINARLREISWKFHPRLRERTEIFVGRNDLINQFEERIDDFSLPSPIAVIASGLSEIGRRSLLRHSLKKSNIIRPSFEFPFVIVSQLDSVEDLILKTLDLGLVGLSRKDFDLHSSVEEKTIFAIKMFREISRERERILIEDQGVLVQPDGQLVDWFSEIINGLASDQFMIFSIVSRYRPASSLNRLNPLVFSVHVAEMDKQERDGLMVRYSRFSEVELSKDDYSFFSDLLTGYPEQVLFTIDLIKEQGIFEAKKNSHTIQQYGSDKAKIVLDSFQNNQKALNFIYLLSRFEFVSYEVLFDIVNEKEYGSILKDLLSSAICEKIGSSSNYIRVNEVIRDYISRNRFGSETGFEGALTAHAKSFLDRYKDEDSDISDYLFSAQESLRSGGVVPEDIIVPSVFLKTIKRIYDEDRKYAEAILLANRVLSRDGSLHKNTVDHVRFIKCQCLARLRKNEFFDEVRKISQPDRDFLYGFYYRLSGDTARAEENLKNVLKKKPRDPRTIGELVLVYMQSEEYQLAFDLARDNYYNRPGNPINANNYLTCLMARDWTPECKREIDIVISRLEIDTSERAREMVASAKARILAFFENNQSSAMASIERTIAEFPGVNYPLLTKADLAVHFMDVDKLREAVDELERITGKYAQTYRSVIKFKSLLLAMEGRTPEARNLINRELSGLNSSTRTRLIDRIESFSR
ncbi:toll/interleukin-1 receptor domain-containing protein [Aquitalea palustris]|uniref:Toll/interleukin-1 receptor domain-containing protein n=2 Tax=Aquitalea palustris TaxID=2480983 RepID=A0A454JM50_9NEIS|nr:toll/interleukin-1 receptor domain-containing protein [Aquitalea palustris]RMD00900.1 toll/interleukin-1 receptor domain-containing protein [Aquitalea palustris]